MISSSEASIELSHYADVYISSLDAVKSKIQNGNNKTFNLENEKLKSPEQWSQSWRKMARNL